MAVYDNHLVSGEALRAVLQDVHGDQQRQDDAISYVEASLPEALDATEISALWNKS